MGASAATFEAISHVPAFYGARHNGGHSATYFHPGGGEFANVASNWLLWTFKGDKEAGKMFVGNACSLCTNSNWDVKSKGINKCNRTPRGTLRVRGGRRVRDAPIES